MSVRQWTRCSLLLLGTVGWSHTGFATEYVYLLAGQSNMMGRGKVSELAPGLRQTPANVSFYYQGRQQPLARFSHFGPEVLLAHRLAQALPDDHHILVKFAASGSYLRQWLPGSPLYKGLLRQLSYIPTWSGKPASLSAIFWMQGESDARSAKSAQAYGSRLQYLIRRLRTDTGSPGAAAFIGKINPGSDAFHWRTQIQDQQQQATQTLPMTYLVDTGGLGKLWDQLHYDARGQIGLGERFASRFLQQHRPARTDRPPAAAIPAAAPMPPSPTTATARPDNENTRPISRLVSTSPETTVHAASSGTIASSNTVPSSKQQTLRQQAERQAERRAAWQQRRQQQRQRQYLRLLEYQQRQQQYRQRTPE